MNLRSIDLNLLVIFDSLMAERHVTRAAGRVGMSQSAMSNALARLRHLFDDELFIRGSSGMEPTPRALELGEQVARILRQAERMMSADVGFDPTVARRHFTARMSDAIGYLLLPRLVAHLAGVAPNVGLNVLHLSPDATLRALEADELDFAVSMALAQPSGIRSEPLFEDAMCCVMRAGHPLAGEALTLDAFLGTPHMKVSMSATDARFVDDVLARRGLQRTIALNVPHWLLVPPVLSSSDLLAVVPRKLATAFAGHGLVTAMLPFESRSFSWNLYWHRRHEKSASNAWIRESVRSAGAAL
jgi:DNA-binding transcriptional LysR family regulator